MAGGAGQALEVRRDVARSALRDEQRRLDREVWFGVTVWFLQTLFTERLRKWMLRFHSRFLCCRMGF